MIELMVVVIIIAVVAALTIPSIVSRMRERRAGEAASRVALLFQMARSEAIGRGAAVLVRYTQSTRGAFLVREAQRGTSAGAGCQSLPEPSCTITDFNNAGPQQYRDVTSLDFGQRAEYSQVRAVMVAPGGANPAALDLCFTPMGRTFMRTNLNGTFAPLTGIYQASVYRGDVGEPIGLTRNVMLLPNGIARIVAVAEPTP
jgi:type IV fimbrial biogenesis protein FimT